ncbi:MAG: M48 family metalloprotease, partial [Elusimicrobiota bacterium]
MTDEKNATAQVSGPLPASPLGGPFAELSALEAPEALIREAALDAGEGSILVKRKFGEAVAGDAIVNHSAVAVEKIYRHKKILANLKSLGIVSVLVGLAAYTTWHNARSSGWSGLNPVIYLIALILLVPIIRELFQRLNQVSPKGMPVLDPKKYPGIYREVQGFSKKANLQMPKLLFWNTEMPNAAATGVETPMLVTKTYVIFTKGILNTMKPGELAGIIGHELSHIRHHDIVFKITGILTALILQLNILVMKAPLLLSLAILVAANLFSGALSRTREYLADQGSAALTGRPGNLAVGLLKLDFWRRMVLGANSAPVGTRTLDNLTQSHPPVLSRAEILRRLEIKSISTEDSGLSAKGKARAGGSSVKTWAIRTKSVWISHANGFLMIFGPAVVLLACLKLPFIVGAPLFLVLNFAIAGLQFILGRLGHRPGVITDRILAYLSHPDQKIRLWSVTALRQMIARTKTISTLESARAAVISASLQENASPIKTELGWTAWRLEAKKRLILRQESSRQETWHKALKARFEALRQSGVTREDHEGYRSALALLNGAIEPPEIAALNGPPALDLLKTWNLYLIPELSRAPPTNQLPSFLFPLFFDNSISALEMRYLFLDSDNPNPNLYIHEPFWQSLNEPARAGLLWRIAVHAKARQAFKSSGKFWVSQDPEVKKLHNLIQSQTPVKGGRPDASQAAAKKILLSKNLSETTAFIKSSLPNIATLVTVKLPKIAQARLFNLSTLSLAALGAGFAVFGITRGSPVISSLLMGLAAIKGWRAVSAQKKEKNWDRNDLNSYARSLLLFALPATIGLAALGLNLHLPWAWSWSQALAALGQSFALSWFSIASLQNFLRERFTWQNEPALKFSKILLATAIATAMAASSLALDAATLCKTIILSSFFLHLARHGAKAPAYLNGLALAGISWLVFLAGYPNLSLAAVLIAAHYFGKRLTKNLKPAEIESSTLKPDQNLPSRTLGLIKNKFPLILLALGIGASTLLYAGPALASTAATLAYHSHAPWLAPAVALGLAAIGITFWSKRQNQTQNLYDDLDQLGFNDPVLKKAAQAVGHAYQKFRKAKPMGRLGGRKEIFTQRDVTRAWALAFRRRYLQLKQLTEARFAALFAYAEAMEFAYGAALDYDPDNPDNENNPAKNGDRLAYRQILYVNLKNLAKDLGFTIPPDIESKARDPDRVKTDDIPKMLKALKPDSISDPLDVLLNNAKKIPGIPGAQPTTLNNASGDLGKSGAILRLPEEMNRQFYTEVKVAGQTVPIGSANRLIDHLKTAVELNLIPCLVGPTGTGKSAAPKWLAAHNDMAHLAVAMKPAVGKEEMIGSIRPTSKGLAWQWGFLIKAMFRGDWVTLEEFNLAPTEVLEALNEFFNTGVIHLSQHLDEETLKVVLPA